MAQIAIASGAIAAVQSAALAQVINDHNLVGATIVERGTCSILSIEFYTRVQLHSHFPHAASDELRIQLKGLDRGPAPLAAKSPADKNDKLEPTSTSPRREQVRAPASERAAISAIELENTGIDQTLSIHFRHAVAFAVGPGKDPRTILVAIAGRAANSDCKPVIDAGVDANASTVPRTRSPSGNAALDDDMAQARAALAKSDNDRAIAFLTRIVEAGSTKLLPEALELLGLAREQKGHIAHARADYKSYLKQFPSGSGNTRVQQRLATLDKRELAKQQIAAPPALPPPSPTTKLDGKTLTAKPSSAPSSPAPTTLADRSGDPSPISPWTLQHSGSISTFYNLNQGGRDFFTRPNQQQGWEKENIYQVYRNSILAQEYYDGSIANAFFQARLRVSGSQEHRFTDGTDQLRISTLDVEMKHKESGSTVRFGRQNHYGGGILGRFDGAIATVPIADLWKLRVYSGSPVERSTDQPFLYDRYFYGASLDYKVSKRLDVGGYVIDQRTDSFVDRRAVGAEARYVGDMHHGFATMDYDLHFNEINSILGTGTMNFADRSSITAMIDYRRSPTMFASNALQGQIETTLRDLLRRYTMQEIEDLARDRTPKSTVASLTYSRYLRENLQATAEFTLTNMSSMPESGGVAWTPSSGWDTYSMLQLMATDVFRPNDSVTGSLRYASTQSANRLMLEGSLRMPTWNPDWRIGPMVRLGLATYKREPIKEYIIHPMLRTSYNLSRDMLLEFEVGKRWTMRDNYQGRANETEILVLGGVRYDFHSAR